MHLPPFIPPSLSTIHLWASATQDWAQAVAAMPLLAWLVLLLLPWRPWSTREQVEPAAAPDNPSPDLSDITVLIPARNEAAILGATLGSLNHQGRPGPRIIVIDDQSTDETAEVAKGAGNERLEVLKGTALPEGWAGKLWALEQGRKQVGTGLILLLDADITLEPGMLSRLKARLRDQQLDFISIMARLRMSSFWERLLVPAFVYFFKLLYPFALGNSERSRIGVAAGGCILVRAEALDAIGAFASLRDALIDDCTLARQLKQAGRRGWTGLSHSVRSHRAYDSLGTLWNMVARSAFTQLRHSSLLLAATTLVMLLLFWAPPLLVSAEEASVRLMSLAALLLMMACYLPTLLYYRRSPLWALALPAIALIYLLMTWTSAIRHWRGRTAQWKGRSYDRPQGLRGQ